MKRSVRILWAVVLAVLVAGVGLSGSAAAPPPSGGPSDLVVPSKPGLSAFERGLVSAYDTENAWDKARFISTANDGWADRIGLIGKVSGTPEERAVAEYIRDALAPYLDEVHIREYITTSWDFRGSELRVVAPEADVAYPSSGYGLCYGSWGRVDAHASAGCGGLA